MKILIIGDLHGIKPKIHFKEFDCIVQVGDVCDDSEFRPYIKKLFKLFKKYGEDSPSMEELMLLDIGEKGIKEMEKNSLIRGREILKYLNSLGKPIFMVAGNWDQSYGLSKIKNLDKSDYNYMKAFYDWYLGDKINPKLIKGLKNIKDCMYKNYEFSGINFVGYGLSSGGENLKRGNNKKLNVNKKQYEKLKKAYNKIKNKLSSAYKKRNKKFPVIFISHNIPYNTKLDIVKDKKSYVNKKHLGSWIARKFCEKYQPLLCIGGHVHEGKGKDKIGKTILINPGFGKDASVLIDLDEKKGKVRKIEFYK